MPPMNNPSPLRKLRFILWVLVAAAAVALALLLLRPGGQVPRPAPQQDYAAAIGGPFELTAPDGKTVTDRDLRGRPFALFFGFTRCPDVCPTTLARLAKLRSQMGKDGDKFQIVFVSVDPEADTPADIGRYVALFGTPIIGLTGTPEQIERIAKAYKIYYAKVPQDGGNYTVDHSATVFLMDRNGRFQSTLDNQESDSAALGKLRRLVA
jgi:protein SCO1/2